MNKDSIRTVTVIIILINGLFTHLLWSQGTIWYKSAIPGAPSVHSVTITQPAYKDFVVFGYGTYSDNVAESGSQYQWLKNSEVIASGTLSKVMLIHFNDGFASEEGYSPIENTVQLVDDGKFGKGVRIEQGQKLSYPMPEGYSASEGTIEAWVKPDWNSATPGEPKHYIYSEKNGSVNKLSMFHWQDGEKLHSLGEGFDMFAKEIIWMPEEWHHVAIVFGNGKIKFLVDGQPSESRNYARTTIGTKFYIGCEGNNLTNNFKGVIDEIRIHNRALTDKEVYESMAQDMEWPSNLQMLDLSSISVGDVIQFKYKARNSNGQEGIWTASPTVTVEEFQSSIDVYANDVIKHLNRGIIGAAIPYDPQPFFDEFGDYIFSYPQAKTWDADNNEPRQATVNLLEPLNMGSARGFMFYTFGNYGGEMIDRLERLKYVYDAIGIPTSEAIVTFWCLDQLETAIDEGVIENSYARGLGFNYWELLNEPDGTYNWPGMTGGGCGDPPINPETGQPFESAEELAVWTINEYGPQIHAINSNAKVGIEFRESFAIQFMDQINPEAIDFMAIHPYASIYVSPSFDDVDNLTPEQVRDWHNEIIGRVEDHMDGDAIAYARNVIDTRFPKQLELHATEWASGNAPNRYGCGDFDYGKSNKTLTAMLGDATFLNRLLYNELLETTNYWAWSYGDLPTRRGEPQLSYRLFELYSDLGTEILRQETNTFRFSAPAAFAHWGGRQNVSSLDVLATKKLDNSRLYLIVVNREWNKDVAAEINLHGFQPQGDAHVKYINVGPNADWEGAGGEIHEEYLAVMQSTGPGVLHPITQWGAGYDQWYYNEENVPLTETQEDLDHSFTYTFPAHSVTAFEISGCPSPHAAVPFVQ